MDPILDNTRRTSEKEVGFGLYSRLIVLGLTNHNKKVIYHFLGYYFQMTSGGGRGLKIIYEISRPGIAQEQKKASQFYCSRGGKSMETIPCVERENYFQQVKHTDFIQ